MHTPHDYIYINAFNQIPGIGPQKLYKLSDHFNAFSDAWDADVDELITAGLSQKLAETIRDTRTSIEPAAQWQRCADENISLISVFDDVFPEKLKKISNPPFCLYVRGNTDALNTKSVAIVGSRKISTYGTQATTSITRDIALSDITIISGLALGTDALTHRTTLESGGTTVAVLGGGINDAVITPRSHINLAKDILESGGAVISEYPVDTEPHRGTFPARNRIMAGLADATIIIEAAKKSGTLITAECAQKFDRPLFALPGSIFTENAFGPNMLIRDASATPLLSSTDILDLFHKKQPTSTQTATFTDKNQETLYGIIKKHSDGVHVNQLIKTSSLDATTISSTLTMMEIDGVVKNTGNQTYVAL